jgi:hypothetical protein
LKQPVSFTLYIMCTYTWKTYIYIRIYIYIYIYVYIYIYLSGWKASFTSQKWRFKQQKLAKKVEVPLRT